MLFYSTVLALRDTKMFSDFASIVKQLACLRPDIFTDYIHIPDSVSAISFYLYWQGILAVIYPLMRWSLSAKSF